MRRHTTREAPTITPNRVSVKFEIKYSFAGTTYLNIYAKITNVRIGKRVTGMFLMLTNDALPRSSLH